MKKSTKKVTKLILLIIKYELSVEKTVDIIILDDTSRTEDKNVLNILFFFVFNK